MKKAIGIALMVLVAATFLSSTVPVNSENMDNWNYRFIITIDNTNNPQKLTDYQVLVNLDSNNFDFSQTQPDGDDLRFTNRNGDMLPYWIESYDSTSEKARIWVKVDSIPASGITKMFMYYGNPAAISASSGTATFDFFDDFSSNTLTIDNSGDPCTATKPLPQQFTDNFMVMFTAKKVRQGWCANLNFGLRDTLGRIMSARYYWCDNLGNYQLRYPSSGQTNHYQPSNGFLHKTTLSKIGSTYEKIVYDMSDNVVNTLTGTDGIPDAVFDEVYFAARKHTIGYISYNSEDGGYYDLSGMKDAYSTFYVYNMKIRKYTDPEPTVSFEITTISIWDGSSQRVSFNQMLRPLASFRIFQAEHLKEEVYLLLQEALEKGIDVSEVQPLIETADNLLEDAKKFYSSGNCIAANNLALQAMHLYAQAVEILEELLK